ncbi:MULTISPECIES: hypothetical protein [Natrialbaceae]|uniref:hypothetical protein n=1 Tax=Natrialbaceae TaxID=1644061 RepID=UPI00207CC0AE|nr:hypothetical protein [Natronococcus sp. CG52]
MGLSAVQKFLEVPKGDPCVLRSQYELVLTCLGDTVAVFIGNLVYCPRDLAVGEQTLKVYFRNMGANDQAFIDTFAGSFYENESVVDDLLPSSAEVTGNKRNMIEATYDIDVDAYEGFFDAYVAALQDAFVDLVVENEELIATIDELYDESIDQVYGVSPSS